MPPEGVKGTNGGSALCGVRGPAVLELTSLEEAVSEHFRIDSSP